MQKLATANERRSDNLSQEEEEKRIEKELSEIYKDNGNIRKITIMLPCSTK